MIKLKEACEIAKKQIPNSEVESVLDVGTFWVIGLCDAETKEGFDEPPLQVFKEDGKVSSFFPPDHIEELENAKEIEL